MLGWMIYWTWWFTWRSVLTFACMFTVQNVIHQAGYLIEWKTLLVATLCAIVGIRVGCHLVSERSMLLVISIAFGVYIVVSLWYMHRLNARIRAHEKCWDQIEKLTDHNKDGDVVIHVKHI